MPLLFIRRTGRVEVKNRENGSMFLTGYSNGGKTSYVNFVFRFNPNTKTADLLYFDSSNSTEATASLKTMLDKIEFNKPLPVKEGFLMLSAFMGISREKVKTRFSKAEGCNEVLFNRSFANLHPTISVAFKVKGEQPAFRCMYDYRIDLDEVELTYSNDGAGNIWSKGSETKGNYG